MNLLNSILCQADTQFAREDWTAARDSLQIALGLAPDQPQLLGTLGNLHYLLKEYREACTAFTAALEHGSADYDLLTRLAIAHRELNEHDEMEGVLVRVLRLEPGDSFGMMLLADCYREQGRPREAARIYEQLLDRHPDHVGVLLALAKLFHRAGDWAAAKVALERVLHVDPQNELARENLAVMNARASAEAFVAADRGVTVVHGGNRGRQLQDFQQARRRPPARPRAGRAGKAVASNPGFYHGSGCR